MDPNRLKYFQPVEVRPNHSRRHRIYAYRRAGGYPSGQEYLQGAPMAPAPRPRTPIPDEPPKMTTRLFRKSGSLFDEFSLYSTFFTRTVKDACDVHAIHA